MKSDISDLKSDVANLKKGQDRIEVKLDAVFNQTAEFQQFKIEMNKKIDCLRNDLNVIELVTAKNWKEILELKTKH